MEQTTLASPLEMEEISILREEKPADHPGLSSNGCSLPKRAGSISAQKQCPLNVPDAELVDEFQKVFPTQTEEEDAPVIENPDDLVPATQENAAFTQKIPGGRTDSLEPAYLSGGAIGNIFKGASDDEEEQGEECKTDGEYLSAHVLENSTNKAVEDMGDSSKMGHKSARKVFCAGLPHVEGDTANETSKKLLNSKMEENLDLTCPEQCSDLDIQLELGFAEQKEHQDDYAALHIAEDEGHESTETPASPSPLPEDSARVSVQMSTEKNLHYLEDVELFSANEILEVDAQFAEEVQTQAESADTEDTGKMQIVDLYFEEEAIPSKCSESQSSAESIVNDHTPSSPVEPQSQACEPEKGTAVSEVDSTDNLHQPQHDDLIQANNQTNQALPSSDTSHTDLVSSDADVLETCVNITQTEPAKSIEQEEGAEKTGTAKQICTAQETTAKCKDTSHASDSESDDNMECMNTLQPHLHWASTAEETDTTDETSVEAVFPLQFTKLEVTENEEDLQDNPTVSENFCEKHEVSYCLALPTETLNSANDAVMAPDSAASQKPNPDVLTAFENCIDIRESPDADICSLLTANVSQTVVLEEDEKVVTFAMPAAEALHAHQMPGEDFNVCECVPQQVFVQFSGDATYLINVESGTQPQEDGRSESPVLLEPAEEVAASPPSPTVEATKPAIAPQSASGLDQPQVYVIPPDEDQDSEHLLIANGISAGSLATSEYSDIQLESPLPTDVPSAMEPITEITDLPSQQNSPFVHESGSEIYGSSNSSNVCRVILCSAAEDNETDLDTAHGADMSVNDTPKVEEAVSFFVAETASLEETSAEIVEEQLAEAPFLSPFCDILPAALVTNVPQELHLLPFASESAHLALEHHEVEIARAISNETPSLSATEPPETSVSTNFTPTVIDTTDFPLQQNFFRECELEEVCDDSKIPGIFGEVPRSPTYENLEDSTSVNDIQEVENKVTCWFAATTSTEVPLEEKAEEPLGITPSLSDNCNILPDALVTNVPHDLHLSAFASESAHLALEHHEVEIAQAVSSETPSLFATEPLDSSLSTNVTPATEYMIETTDFYSQKNSSCVRELEDDLYESNNTKICGEIPCLPAYENVENLHTVDVEDDISASDTQKVENKVTCFFAETATTDVPVEEIAEAPRNMAPPLFQACNTMPTALITNIPQELHESPFTSESTHLALGPEEVGIARATSSEIPSVLAAALVESSPFEGLHSRKVREEGSYKACESKAQTSQPSACDEYLSITEPRSLMDSTKEAPYSFPSERSSEHSVVQCEKEPQLRAEIPLKETVKSSEEELEQEEKETYLEEADVIISVQATKPCMEMPISISNYMENRQYGSENKQIVGATDEQHQQRINGQASEDFNDRYAEFLERALPGSERFYPKKPNQISFEVGDRPGVLREMQNRELSALPISLYAPAHGYQRDQKRRFLEPEPAVNDDYLYPDAVTPSKVEKSLSAVETNAEKKENRYDVPFIDDDAFLPRRLRSPSHASTITEDETSSELGYSYGYYEERYMKVGRLAIDDELKSNQEMASLTGSQRGFQVGSNSFRWDFSLKMCGCLQRKRRRRL